MTMNMNIEKQILRSQELDLDLYRERVEDWTSDYPYGWWITLSFVGEKWEYPFDIAVKDEGLKKVNAWLMFLARTHEAHFVPFRSVEPFGKGGRFSVHVVLLSDKPIRVNDLKSKWKHGNTEIKKYKHELGAITYTFKDHVAVESWVICSGKRPCRVNRKGKILCMHERHRESIV